jgi:uncharacterized protein
MIPGVVDPVSFRYHPDPAATGSAVPGPEPCEVCGEPARLTYVGPIHGDECDVLCLACIGSGRAASALADDAGPAQFTDVTDVPRDVPAEVVDELSHRTPGFFAWQQEHWLFHCADAAAFLGRAGYDRLREHPDALDMVLADLRRLGYAEERARRTAATLHVDGDATAYLFRCLHCGRHLAYWDLG